MASNGSGYGSREMMDAPSDWERKGSRPISVQAHGTRYGNGGGGDFDEVPLISHRIIESDMQSTSSSMSDSAGLRAQEVGVSSDPRRTQPEIAHRASGRMCFGVSLPGTGHTEYVFQISGSTGKVWKVSRRYSEFLELDSKLRQMFGKPTRPFPPLPRKVLIGNQADDVVSERQQMLTRYLQAVLENNILSSTAEVQRFIEMEADVEPAVPSVFRSNLPRRMP